jgi:hypothetical protein
LSAQVVAAVMTQVVAAEQVDSKPPQVSPFLVEFQLP